MENEMTAGAIQVTYLMICSAPVEEAEMREEVVVAPVVQGQVVAEVEARTAGARLAVEGIPSCEAVVPSLGAAVPWIAVVDP